MSKWYLLLFFSVLYVITLQAQGPDSLQTREIRTGVYTHFESISEKVLGKSTGYSAEVGAFQERKLLEQVYFSYGGGFKYRDYNDTGILVDTTPNTDTAIISHFYDVAHNELKVGAFARIKFSYLQNPNVYLIVGLGPEISIQREVENKFLKTRYVNSEFVTIGEDTEPEFPVDENEFRPNVFNLRFDLGLGIELGRFNIEIMNRADNVQGLGLHIKYIFDTLTY